MRCNWMLGLACAGALLFAVAGCDSGTTNPPADGYDGNQGDGDGGDCPVLCSVDDDCCDGFSCVDGLCIEADACPSGCNYECSKENGQICDQGTKKCIPGAPPLNCQNDCNCFAGEVCDQGACVPSCTGDEDCPQGMECRDSRCRPASCSTREDCDDGQNCLVCKNQECVAEPQVCAGDSDCCVGRRCNFGTCVGGPTGCQADSDCTADPDLPRCVDGTCVQECVNNIDCPVGKVCIDTHCVASGCTPQTCNPGEWCDTGDGNCKPGCDSNDDCTPPATCNYQTHACGQTDCCGNACTAGSQYCDTFTCQCVTLCDPAPACQFNNPNNCCPTNYDCDTNTGKCMCTPAACPAGSTCNAQTGSCEADQSLCNPPCVAPETCVNGVCVVSGTGTDGDPCFTDSECNAAAGFLCDGSIFCIGCMLVDPNFVPEFLCRAECSLLMGTCSGGYSCEYRHLGLKGLCVP